MNLTAPAPTDPLSHLVSDAHGMLDLMVVLHWIEFLFNCAFSVYFVQVVGRTALIHPNLRLLLTWLLVNPFIIFTSGRLFGKANESAWALSVKSQLATNLICVVCRLGFATGIGVGALFITALAIERLFATVLSNTYELRGKSIAFIIIAVTYSVSLLIGIAHIAFDMDKFDWVYGTSTCIADEIRPAALIAYWFAGIASGNIGAVMMMALCWWNKRQSRHAKIALGTHSLATRYQHAENLATMRALLPGLLPYAVLTFLGMPVGYYMSTYYNIWKRMDSDMLRLHLEIVYMIVDMFAIMIKASFLGLYAPLRSQLARDLWRYCGRSRVANNRANVMDQPPAIWSVNINVKGRTVGQVYFDQLESAWHPKRSAGRAGAFRRVQLTSM